MTKIKFETLSKANKARRWILSSVPTYALEFIKLIQNTTCMNKHVIAEILTQIPINSIDDEIGENVQIIIKENKLTFHSPLNTFIDVQDNLDKLLDINKYDLIIAEFKIVKNTPLEGGSKFNLVNSVGIDHENNLLVEYQRNSLKTLNFDMFFCFFDK